MDTPKFIISVLLISNLCICIFSANVNAQNLPIKYPYNKSVLRSACMFKQGEVIYTALQNLDTSNYKSFIGILAFNEIDSTQQFLSLTDTIFNYKTFIEPKKLSITHDSGYVLAYQVDNRLTDSQVCFVLKVEFNLHKNQLRSFKYQIAFPVSNSNTIDRIRLSELTTDSFTFYYGSYLTDALSSQQSAFIIKVNKDGNVVNQVSDTGNLDPVYGYRLGTMLSIDDTLVCFNSISAYKELNKRSMSSLQVVAAYPLTRGFSAQSNDNYLHASNNFEHGTVKGKSSIYQFVTVDTVYQPNPPAADYMWRAAVRKYDYKSNRMIAGKPLHQDIQGDEYNICYWLWNNNRYVLLDEERNALYVFATLLESSEQLYVAKFDTNLNLIWQRFMVADLNDFSKRYILRDAALDSNKFIYLTGDIYKSGYSTPFLMKLDVNNGFYSGISEKPTNSTTFLVYPNPVQNTLFFTSGINECWVYNSFGQLIKHQIKPDYLDMSALPTGIYWLQLNLDGVIYYQKVLKN